jgi:thiol-disulfide isomerase/thioredoxin
MKRTTWATLGIAVVFLAVGAYAGMRHWSPKPAQPAAVAELMAQTLPDQSGAPQRFDQWQGKILVVNFWATWCAPCVKEMPALSALQTELSGQPIQIIGVGIDSPANIREFVAKYKITYPLMVAGMAGAKITRAFGNQVGGLPFTVIIGKQGEIQKTYTGELNMADLRRDLQAM